MTRAHPLVIAHRGASGERPENTLSAYALAVAQRADMIEIDLHCTRDGSIVVAHDEGLAGIGGRGEIADHSLAEVRELDAGDGQRVPTLDEVLDGFGRLIPFNLELKKGTTGPYPGLEAASVEAASTRGLLGHTLFSSFDDPVLEALRGCGSDVRIGVLVSGRASHGWLERAHAVGAEAVHFWVGLADAERVAIAHAAGLAVHAYTVDDAETMRRLLVLGVDGLFTNHPARMREIVDRPG